MERLHKFLARAGVASRRKCEQFILDGKVSVNGEKISKQGFKIDPGKDKVVFNGQVVALPDSIIYLALNKPKGYITTRKDPYSRKTVYELLPDDLRKKAYPVGRLDRNTTGLLFFTNDGDFANKIMHPTKKIAKIYKVLINGKIRSSDLQKLENGVKIGGVITQPVTVKIIEELDSRTRLQISLKEGRYRQVRRMFSALGYEVVSLKRIAIGNINLKGIKLGQYRYLTKKEVVSLLRNKNEPQ